MTRATKAFLVALRIAIGWHFLYEGIWKIQSDTGATAYATSWRPLQTGVARMKEAFDQGRAVDVDAWYDDVVKTFKGRSEALAEDQKARLAELRDQIKLRAAEREPEVINFDWLYVRDAVLRIPAPPVSERFTALPFLQASAGPFRPAFRALVRDIDGLDRLTVASAHAAIDRRAARIAAHYGFTADQRARMDAARDKVKGDFAATWNAPAVERRLADYRLMRTRVRGVADGGPPFERERLAEDRKKLDQIAGDLLALVNEPGDELAVQAHSIATVAQMSAGPVPRPETPSDWIDSLMKWGLTAIGACLLLGLFTRYAAIAAAAELATFYFASPPWPGLPATTLGGHYMFVDRNLIELIAALVIFSAFRGAGARIWSPVPAAGRRLEIEEVRSLV